MRHSCFPRIFVVVQLQAVDLNSLCHFLWPQMKFVHFFVSETCFRCDLYWSICVHLNVEYRCVCYIDIRANSLQISSKVLFEIRWSLPCGNCKPLANQFILLFRCYSLIQTNDSIYCGTQLIFDIRLRQRLAMYYNYLYVSDKQIPTSKRRKQN